jgi:hypothetical protein
LETATRQRDAEIEGFQNIKTKKEVAQLKK